MNFYSVAKLSAFVSISTLLLACSEVGRFGGSGAGSTKKAASKASVLEKNATVLDGALVVPKGSYSSTLEHFRVAIANVSNDQFSFGFYSFANLKDTLQQFEPEFEELSLKYPSVADFVQSRGLDPYAPIDEDAVDTSLSQLEVTLSNSGVAENTAVAEAMGSNVDAKQTELESKLFTLAFVAQSHAGAKASASPAGLGLLCGDDWLTGQTEAQCEARAHRIHCRRHPDACKAAEAAEQRRRSNQGEQQSDGAEQKLDGDEQKLDGGQ